MPHLLIVEDDLVLARALQQGLSEDGYEVVLAGNTDDARSQWNRTRPHLIILDLNLPGEDGLVLLNELEGHPNRPPIIIITARGLLADRLRGLKQGADDYLVKPFAVAELLARVQAVLRRAGQSDPVLQRGEMTADLREHVIRVRGEIVDLTAREVSLLVYLMQLEGRPASREMLARDVWRIRSRATAMDNVIEVSVSRLRRKLQATPGAPPLRTLRGIGYALGDIPCD